MRRPACGIGGLGRDVAWAGRVGLRQWPRVPAVGADRGPTARHTVAARAEGLSLFPRRLASRPRAGVGRDRAPQCDQDSRACGRLETPRFGLRARGGSGRVAQRCPAEADPRLPPRERAGPGVPATPERGSELLGAGAT